MGAVIVAVEQRGDVETGPANEDRQVASLADGGNQLPRARQPVRHGEGLVWRDEVEEMMRDRCARRGIRLRSAHIHAAVYLARTGDEDLDRHAVSECQGEIGLA